MSSPVAIAADSIDIREVSKSYGGVHALRNINLRLEPAEVHALCGENGAGKSTLIKVLSGSVIPDQGVIDAAGRILRPGDVRNSEGAGIAVVHQDPVVFPDLDAVENVFAGREQTRLARLWLDRRAMVRRTRELLSELGESFDLTTPVGSLPFAQRQSVAIARALHRAGGACRLLILDEPTASLSHHETEVLFRIVRRLKGQGAAVLYVSHRLDEIFELADRVSVLRDGEMVGTRAIGEVDRQALVRLMVGRDAPEASKAEGGRAHGGVLLGVEGLTRRGAFDGVTLSVHAGEIVGLAGLVGAGRSEVARAIAGIDRWDSGTVSICGTSIPPASARRALSLGLALVPEDRQHEGLVLPMSVGANLTMAVLGSLTHLGLRSHRREREAAAGLVGQLAIRAPGLGAPVQSLSGGNQQKVLLGKWLAARPRVLILDEPTRGVDVGAKAEVHRLIRELAAGGMATLLISSDLPEVLALADRVYVMRQGRVAGELAGPEATQERVLALALPASSPADGATKGAAA